MNRFAVNPLGLIWERVKKFLFVLLPIAAVLVVGVLRCNYGEVRDDTPIYDASCTDVALQASANRSLNLDFRETYEICRAEVEAGRAVRWYENHFVPPDGTPDRLPCDCTASVAMAVDVTVDRCSQVLDCKNEERHPEDCSDDCKYHALENALGGGYQPPDDPDVPADIWDAP